MVDDSSDRHSKAQTVVLITDPDELAILEARNGLKQFDVTCSLIDEFINTEGPFKLRSSIVLQLHRAALDGISQFSGNFCPAGVEIKGSDHEPVGAHLVAEYIEDMCDYVMEKWGTVSPLHLSAFVMWRLNWIHPFDDGNGRTSRALSYLVLCVGTGIQLPGTNTIPEQISKNKRPYYEALEAADKHYKEHGNFDLKELESLLEGMLADQLIEVYNAAKGDGENGAIEPKIFH